MPVLWTIGVQYFITKKHDHSFMGLFIAFSFGAGSKERENRHIDARENYGAGVEEAGGYLTVRRRYRKTIVTPKKEAPLPPGSTG